MKNHIKYFIVTLVAALTIACDKDDNQKIVSDQLTINYRNMRGVWSLTSLDGQEIEGAAYFYISFSLNDETQEFESYTNFNSAFSSKSKGEYNIEQNLDGVVIISGIYYNQFQAPWESRYIISDFTANKMEWVDTSSGEVRSFERVSEIPSDILAGTRVQ